MQMKLPKLYYITVAFCVVGLNSFAQNKNTAEYKINDSIVTQKKFDLFLSSLKEVERTWYCKKTTTGGKTGYDVTDKNGTIYTYIAVTDGKKNTNAIKKKTVQK